MQLNLYLVSDSSGETASAVGRAAVTQFQNVHVAEYMWPLLRSTEQVDMLLVEITSKPGVVINTMIDSPVRSYLEASCKALLIPYVCPVQSVVEVIAAHSHLTPSKSTPGKHAKLDEAYYNRIAAITFTMDHDDGKNLHEYAEADILILGPSRSSKSPTSLFLAHRGYKVANLPIYPGLDPSIIYGLQGPLIVGLTIDPTLLCTIRTTRFSQNHKGESAVAGAIGAAVQPVRLLQQNYCSLHQIRDELREANRFYAELGVPVVNVTQKAVEEVAAEIIMHFFEKTGKNLYSDFQL